MSCTEWLYEGAAMSRLLEIIGLFCRMSSVLQGSFAKETYNFKEPTNRSHPVRVSFFRNYNEQWVGRWWRLLKLMNFLYTTEYRSDFWLFVSWFGTVSSRRENLELFSEDRAVFLLFPSLLHVFPHMCKFLSLKKRWDVMNMTEFMKSHEHGWKEIRFPFESLKKRWESLQKRYHVFLSHSKRVENSSTWMSACASISMNPHLFLSLRKLYIWGKTCKRDLNTGNIALCSEKSPTFSLRACASICMNLSLSLSMNPLLHLC